MLVLEIAGEANGTVEILLRPDIAPQHVAQITALVREGAYNGIVFHRVIEGFMAQTGDVQFGKREGYQSAMAGRGGSDRPDIPAEFSDLHFGAGIVGMARSNEPNSANSQFFIMFTDANSLDGNYTVFGRVVEGMDVINAIKLGSRSANGSVAADPDYIARAYIKADGAPE
ncbi:MAG TPA: peptidylprolyl isomerase [Rhodobacteraceae bacterium]|nr:peptidylprolyl isomerase [Paracoccaceae bacterium]